MHLIMVTINYIRMYLEKAHRISKIPEPSPYSDWEEGKASIQIRTVLFHTYCAVRVQEHMGV